MSDVQRLKTILLPALFVAALTFAACNIRLGGNDGEMIIEGQVIETGGPQVPATLSAPNGSTVSDGGFFSLHLSGPNSRVALKVTATGYAPTFTVVEQRAGVFHYHADVALLTPVLVTPGADGGSFTLDSDGQAIFGTVGAGAVPLGGHLEVTSASASNGPGAMETSEGSDRRLQTLCMVHVRAVDASGKPVPLGAPVSFTTTNQPVPPDSAAAKTYNLGDDGVWKPAPTTTATGDNLVAQQEGWWNSDRGVKIACAKGKVVAPSRTCGGERVKAGGLHGIYSQDTAGADGQFCVEGPQGWTQTLTVGSKSMPIHFASRAASCAANLADCLDLGEVTAADADCPLSCGKGEVDSPEGCKKASSNGSGGGGGSGGGTGGSGGGNFTCGKPPGGCAAMGSGFTDSQLGNGCCVYTACSKGGQQGSCSNECQGWYEGGGQLFGPCNSGDTACIMAAASQLNQACP